MKARWVLDLMAAGSLAVGLASVADANVTPSAQQIAIYCASRVGADVNAFAACAGGRVIVPASQQMFIDCVGSGDARSYAECVGPRLLSQHITQDQKAIINCAVRSNGAAGAFASCMGNRFLGQRLSPDQLAAIDCARQYTDPRSLALCASTRILGKRLSPEQQVAMECAVQSQGDGMGFATCAGAKILRINLNPEQQIAVQCVVQTGGQPYAAAGCIATRLTMRELQKCITDGIGGRGCFGDTNDLTGRNGWTMRTLRNAAHDVTHGPGPNNDLFGRNGFAGRTLEDIRKSAPPPLVLGKVGGHRVCVPWC